MLSRWPTSGTFRVLAGLLVLAVLAPAPLWGQAPPAFKPERSSIRSRRRSPSTPIRSWRRS